MAALPYLYIRGGILQSQSLDDMRDVYKLVLPFSPDYPYLSNELSYSLASISPPEAYSTYPYRHSQS